MNDYKKNDFWIKKDCETNVSLYYIRLNGFYIEVPKNVYDVCYYSYRKDLRDSRRIQANTISLDNANDNGHNLADIIGISDDIIHKMTSVFLIEEIKKVLVELDLVDREIVSLALFEGKSEAEIAKDLCLSKSAVNYRKTKVFKRLKSTLVNITTWI